MNQRTSFCAENIEFIKGMYDVDRSGETDRIRILGSGGGVVASIVAGVGGLSSLLISAIVAVKFTRETRPEYTQHKAFVNAPTN